jgi:exodeoxyribonuclease VII large subunit
VETLEQRLIQVIQNKLHQQRSLLAVKSAQLWQHNPVVAIQNYQQRLSYAHQRLLSANEQQFKQSKQRLAIVSQTLHAVSPLATLNRGYALTIEPESGQIIRSTAQLKVGDVLETRLAQGIFLSEVKTIDQK